MHPAPRPRQRRHLRGDVGPDQGRRRGASAPGTADKSGLRLLPGVSWWYRIEGWIRRWWDDSSDTAGCRTSAAVPLAFLDSEYQPNPIVKLRHGGGRDPPHIPIQHAFIEGQQLGNIDDRVAG